MFEPPFPEINEKNDLNLVGEENDFKSLLLTYHFIFYDNSHTCFAFAIALITWIQSNDVLGKLSAVAVRCSVWSANGVGRVKAMLKRTWRVSGAVADDVNPSHSWGIEGSRSYWKQKEYQDFFTENYQNIWGISII